MTIAYLGYVLSNNDQTCVIERVFDGSESLCKFAITQVLDVS